MSSGFGENSKPKANSDDYRNSSYWDGVEKRKKEAAKKKRKKKE